MQSTSHENIIILDFGGQYTQLIARRVREAGVYCEILPYNVSIEEIQHRQPRGLILSGGPASVYDDAAPQPKPGLLEGADCPVLGICYGLQLIAHGLGGEVRPSTNREYGYARLEVVDSTSQLFRGMPVEMDVWMSHGDHVTVLPDGFRMTAKTADAVNAFENPDRGIYGVQFHPEVAHTPLGAQILRNFLFEVCGCKGDWTPTAAIAEQTERIKERLGENGRDSVRILLDQRFFELRGVVVARWVGARSRSSVALELAPKAIWPNRLNKVRHQRREHLVIRG